MNSPDAVDIRLFQRCVPLNALRAESQADLARKATLLHRPAGETPFHSGDDAAQSLYLIGGGLQFEDTACNALSTLPPNDARATNGKSGAEGKSVYVRGDLGGSRIFKKKKV